MKLTISTNRYFSSIQEFSFVRDIGVGSFGIVRMALHLQTNKCYAVKVIDLNKCSSQNQLLLLQRQINIHTRIDHPHIIKLWDTLIENNTVYMVMELAENGSLFNYQNKHPRLTQAEAYKYFSQSLSAIRYMHTNDLMHRDIKPQNILLDSTNNIKICDLGWATDNIQAKRRTFCGTFEYMAPEIVFDQQYNYSIDIWALGILLYQLLHGHAPFLAKNLEQMKQRVKQGFFEFGSNLGEEVKNIILEILQKQPLKRPQFSTILAHPWFQSMRKGIKNEVFKFQCELQAQSSKRAKVQKQKSSLFASIKKHKRFDSLASSLNVNKKDTILGLNSGTIFQKLPLEIKQSKLKKKCKTLRQQCIQKLFAQSCKAPDTEFKLKKDKQNCSKTQLLSQIPKDTFLLKSEGILSGLKAKKITDKLNDINKKYTLQKKKSKLKTQKQALI